MKNLPKIALGAWAWGNDGTFGNSLAERNGLLSDIQFERCGSNENENYRQTDC